MAASDSSSVVRPQPSGAPEASDGPPMAQAPKPIALTLIPVFPSSRYCIAVDSKSLLRLECDLDDVRVVVVHRSGHSIDNQAHSAEDTGREQHTGITGRWAVYAVAERCDRSQGQTGGGDEIQPVRGIEAALDLDLLRLHAVLLDIDMAAFGLTRNGEPRRRGTAGGDVAGAHDRGVCAGRIRIDGDHFVRAMPDGGAGE